MQSREKELFKAIEAGDYAAFAKVFATVKTDSKDDQKEKNAKRLANAKNEYGIPAILCVTSKIASLQNKEEKDRGPCCQMLEDLIDEGADLNPTSSAGFTALGKLASIVVEADRKEDCPESKLCFRLHANGAEFAAESAARPRIREHAYFKQLFSHSAQSVQEFLKATESGQRFLGFAWRFYGMTSSCPYDDKFTYDFVFSNVLFNDKRVFGRIIAKLSDPKTPKTTQVTIDIDEKRHLTLANGLQIIQCLSGFYALADIIVNYFPDDTYAKMSDLDQLVAAVKPFQKDRIRIALSAPNISSDFVKAHPPRGEWRFALPKGFSPESNGSELKADASLSVSCSSVKRETILRATKMMTAFEEADSKSFDAQFGGVSEEIAEELANVYPGYQQDRNRTWGDPEISDDLRIPIASLVAKKIYELQNVTIAMRAPFIHMLNTLIDHFAHCKFSGPGKSEKPIYYLVKAVIESKAESSPEHDLCFRLWATGAGPKNVEYELAHDEKTREVKSAYIRDLYFETTHELQRDYKDRVSLHLHYVSRMGLSHRVWNEPRNRNYLSRYFSQEFKGDDFKENGLSVTIGPANISLYTAEMLIRAISGNAHIPRLFLLYKHDLDAKQLSAEEIKREQEGFRTIIKALQECRFLTSLRVSSFYHFEMASCFIALSQALIHLTNLKELSVYGFVENNDDKNKVEENKLASHELAKVPVECFEVGAISNALLCEYVANAKTLKSLRLREDKIEVMDVVKQAPLLNYQLVDIQRYVIQRWAPYNLYPSLDNQADFRDYQELETLFTSGEAKSEPPLTPYILPELARLVWSYFAPHTMSLFRLARLLQNAFPEHLRDRIAIEPYIPQQDLGACHGIRVVRDPIFDGNRESTIEFMKAIFGALKQINGDFLEMTHETNGIIEHARSLRHRLFDSKELPVVTARLYAQLLPVYQARIIKMKEQGRMDAQLGIIHKADIAAINEESPQDKKNPDLKTVVASGRMLLRAFKQVENIKPILNLKGLERYLHQALELYTTPVADRPQHQRVLQANVPTAVRQLLDFSLKPLDDKLSEACQCDLGDVIVRPKYDVAGMAKVLFTDEALAKDREGKSKLLEKFKKHFSIVQEFSARLNEESKVSRPCQDFIFRNIFVYPNFIQLHKIQKENIVWLVFVLKVLDKSQLLNLKTFNKIFKIMTDEEKLYDREHVKTVLIKEVPEIKDVDQVIATWEATLPGRLVVVMGMHAAPSANASAAAVAAATPAAVMKSVFEK